MIFSIVIDSFKNASNFRTSAIHFCLFDPLSWSCRWRWNVTTAFEVNWVSLDRSVLQTVLEYCCVLSVMFRYSRRDSLSPLLLLFLAQEYAKCEMTLNSWLGYVALNSPLLSLLCPAVTPLTPNLPSVLYFWTPFEPPSVSPMPCRNALTSAFPSMLFFCTLHVHPSLLTSDRRRPYIFAFQPH